jgi:hypothetical protein
MKVNVVNWDDNFLPLYGDYISIPPNTIMWRGFDPQYPAISDRPAYYGSQIFAQGYAKNYGTNAQPFITTRYLKLLDIRFMKVLLSQLFEYNQSSTKADIMTICSTTVAFGLCSLQHQVKLVKKLYNGVYKSSDSRFDSFKKGVEQLESKINPNSLYEQPGYRIAETSNDSFVMGFLQELFDGQYDGYIAPNLYTPFHIEKRNFILNSEVVLFNPISSGIQLLKTHPKNVEKATINNFVLSSGQNYTSIETRGMETKYYTRNNTKGGGTTSPEICEDYNHLYDKGDKNIIKQYNEGIKMGKKWNQKNIKIYSSIAPGPTIDPKIFEHSLIK